MDDLGNEGVDRRAIDVRSIQERGTANNRQTVRLA